jgi:low affinity Fe/Cu permease
MKADQPGIFLRLANSVARGAGRPYTFIAAVVLLIGWIVTGPIFHFSDTWQLVINTVTSVVTFLMVFLIQNTQNRDSLATQVKLDELIKAVKDARNEVIGLDDLDEAALQEARDDLMKEKDRE